MELLNIVTFDTSLMDILSFIATIAVSFMVYWLQSRHEKEIERMQKEQREKEIEHEAHMFLSEHTDEREYLPWCMFANQLHRHDRHTRKIYTDFSRLSEAVQIAVLGMEGYDNFLLPKEQWFDFCFNNLIVDIQKYGLGHNFLEDDYKYFVRGYGRYKEQNWIDCQYKSIFHPIYKVLWYKPEPDVSCYEYIN